MQFFLASTILASAFAGAAMAATENINIEDLTIHKVGADVTGVSFKLSGEDANDLLCDTGAVDDLPSDVVTCGTSDYRFTLNRGSESAYALTIIHQTGQASGRTGFGDVETECHNGGNGMSSQICQQSMQTTIVISS